MKRTPTIPLAHDSRPPRKKTRMRGEKAACDLHESTATCRQGQVLVVGSALTLRSGCESEASTSTRIVKNILLTCQLQLRNEQTGALLRRRASGPNKTHAVKKCGQTHATVHIDALSPLLNFATTYSSSTRLVSH